MIVVYPDRVVGDEVAVAAVLAIVIFGGRAAANRLHFDRTRRTHTDPDAPVLLEGPIESVIVVTEGHDHTQNQIAAAAAVSVISAGGVPPGEIACFPLEQAGRTRPLLGDAARIRDHGIEVDSVVGAIGAGLEDAGHAAPGVALAHVHERRVIPALRRVLVRHENFRERTFIQNRTWLAAIVEGDAGHDDPYLRIDAEVEIPILPAHLVAIEPETMHRLLDRNGTGHFAGWYRIGIVVTVAARHRHRARVDHADHFLLFGVVQRHEAFDGMRTVVRGSPALRATHAL